MLMRIEDGSIDWGVDLLAVGLTGYRAVGFGKCGVEVSVTGLGCRYWLLRIWTCIYLSIGLWVKRAIEG